MPECKYDVGDVVMCNHNGNYFKGRIEWVSAGKVCTYSLDVIEVYHGTVEEGQTQYKYVEESCLSPADHD